MVDVGGQTFKISIIADKTFYQALRPLPEGLKLERAFFERIKADLVDAAAERAAAAESREITLTFNPGEMYELSPDGRRYANRVLRQTREQMLAQQEADQLHEQLMAERAEYEKSEFYQQKLEDDAALREARIKCLNEMHARRLEAEEFLAREQQEREEQERATVAEISRGPNLPVN
jgi:GTPase Era involved in 16S rRNA processing